MKKLSILILVFIMCTTFSSCGVSKEVVLTTENINDYLSIRYICGEPQHPLNALHAYVPVTIEITPKEEGTFENVELNLFQYLSRGKSVWKVVDNDSSYKYGKRYTVPGEKLEIHQYLVTKISLPSNGKYSEKHTMETFSSAMSLDTLPNEEPDWPWESVPRNWESQYFKAGTPLVSGTFIPDK